MDTEQTSIVIKKQIKIFASHSSQSCLNVLDNLPFVSFVLFLRLPWLNKAMTSNYNSNPSNSLVINKAHIVAEGERVEVRVRGGGGFHFNRHVF